MRLRFFFVFSLILASLSIFALANKTKVKQSIRVLDLYELMQEPESFYNKEIRIRGFVQEASILRRHGEQAEFIIRQERQKQNYRLPVFYQGSTQLPNTFSDGAPIRADGYLDPVTQRFLATSIEAKCASKYEVKDDGYLKLQFPLPYE